MIFLLFLIHVYMTSAQTDDGLSCFECKGVTSPEDCLHVVACSSGEVCHTEEYITDNGYKFYDLGCKLETICTQAGYMVSTEELYKRLNISTGQGGKRRQNIAAHVCQECCDTINCNRLLCEAKVGASLECLSCDGIQNMSDCYTVEVCPEHEVCFVQEWLNDQFKLVYTSGCVRESMCDKFHKEQKETGANQGPCYDCCKDNFCNGVCSREIPTPTPTLTASTTPTPTLTASTTATTTQIVTSANPLTTSTKEVTTALPTTSTAATTEETSAPTTTTTQQVTPTPSTRSTTATTTTTTTTTTQQVTTAPPTRSFTATTTATMPTTTTSQHVSTSPTTIKGTTIAITSTSTTTTTTTTHCPTLPSLSGLPTPHSANNILSDIGCGEKEDITFLVDASQWVNNFEGHEFEMFVRSLASTYDIGPTKTRLSFIHFKETPHQEFSFDIGIDQDKIINHLQNMENKNIWSLSESYLGKGIGGALFQFSTYNRTDAKKYIVILTQDKIADISNAIKEAEHAKSQGTEVLMFGVGSFNTSLDDIKKVVSSPWEKHLFLVDYIDDLATLLQDILLGHCRVSQPKPEHPCWDPTLFNKLGCTTEMDIYLILDQSANTLGTEWEQIKTFINKFVADFDISTNTSEIGMLTVNNNVTDRVHMGNNLRNKQSFINNINNGLNGTTPSGSAFPHLALEHVDEQFQRFNGTKVAVVFTNGGTDRMFPTVAAAMELHRHGINVFVVSLGHDVNPKWQMILATDPDVQHILTLNDVDTLNSYLKYLAAVECQATTTPVPTTTPCPTLPLLALISPPQMYTHMLTDVGCGGKDDIMFLVDSSQFINDFEEHEFELFAKALAGSLDIGRDKARFGYTYFNDISNEVISLSNGADMNYISTALNNLVHSRGHTVHEAHLGAAIQDVLKTMNAQSRADAKKYVVIFTQDNIKRITHAVLAAEHSKNQGIEVFVIGVGQFSQTLGDLENIASSPLEEHLIRVDMVEQLGSILEDIILGHCNGSQVQPVQPCWDPKLLTSLGCGAKEDITLILDQSSNTYSDEWELVKVFIDELIKNFTISPDASRVGMMSFNSSVTELIHFHDIHDKLSLLNDIHTKLSTITPGGRPFTNMALDRTLEWYKNNSTQEAIKVAIIFTNGGTPRKFETLASVMELHRQNVTVFVVGVGHNVDLKEQMILATDPDVEHILNVDNVDGLLDYLEYFAVQRCKGTLQN